MKKFIAISIILFSLSFTAQASFWSNITNYFKQTPKEIQNNMLGGETSDRKPVSNFLGLTDTPDTYSGQSGKCTAVNGASNALEFVACGSSSSGGGSNWSTSTAGVLYPIDYATRRIVTGGNATTTNDYLQALSGFYANTAKIGTLDGYIKGTTGSLYATTTIPASDITGLTSSQWITNGSNIYYPTGFVSIGSSTINSGENLAVISNTASDTGIKIRNAGTGTGQFDGARFSVDGAGNVYLLNYENKDLYLGINTNYNLMVSSTTGYIGIGTTTPSSRLTVWGDQRLTGALYDRLNLAGSAGKYLQSTGTGVEWTTVTSGGATPQDLYTTSTPTFAGLTLTAFSGYGKYIAGVAGTTSSIPWTDISSVPTSISTTTWGSIGGTLSNQTDLQSILDNKAALSGSTSQIFAASTINLGASDTTLSRNSAGILAVEGVIVPKGTGTLNELTYWSGTAGLGSLSVATYPSLTELSYVKGASSSIQTQLNGKQAAGTYSTDIHSNIAALNAVSGTNTGNETTTSIGTLINSASATTTYADAFKFSVYDTVASLFRSTTWANLKAALKTYFDTLYASISTTITAGTGLSGGGDLSTNRTITLNMAGGTCGGTDKISALSATGTITCTADDGGGGTPGGADTEIQFNDGGAFGGSPLMTFNKVTNAIVLGESAKAQLLLNTDNTLLGYESYLSLSDSTSGGSVQLYSSYDSSTEAGAALELKAGDASATSGFDVDGGNLLLQAGAGNGAGARGAVGIVGSSQTAFLNSEALSATQNFAFPDQSGTFALTTDIVALPQSLDTSASPEFAGLTLTGFEGYGRFVGGVAEATTTVPWDDVSSKPNLLISGGTLTNAYHCRYDGTGIDCDRVEDASGACGTNAVCMGGHTHVGVNETYGVGWLADTATPEKDDVYNWGKLFDFDSDGLVNAVDLNAGLIKSGATGTLSIASSGIDYIATTTNLISSSTATTTLSDTDLIAIGVGSILNKITWANLKVALSTAFQALSTKLTNIVNNALSFAVSGNIEYVAPSSLTNATSSGNIITMPVAENSLGFGALLYVNSTSSLSMSSALTTTTLPAIFMALETGVGSKKVLQTGMVRNDNWNFVGMIGQPVYVSSSTIAGATTTMPTATGQTVQIIGIATATNTIDFLPQLLTIGL